ncbi:GIY-YIG nuclease family protein [Fulvivirga lutea]|uniref:GIY-YIG nuclease family protein n=1 Tax=Fulvivirga lutea TaxID=2810512 RepID=A0A974WHD7_9BACT|nr:GIY-YIG nuclease family protein [Fulvivirga lutea]QSE98563.1 GIY-YIG nuclease family protein [Fulvivirga lutea]
MTKGGSIYILTNMNNTTLYVGVTSDLYSRLIEHKEKKYSTSFTSRYNLNKLVYFESFHSIEEAIDREKQLKGGSRKKKVDLIDSSNPDWRDLFDEVASW